MKVLIFIFLIMPFGASSAGLAEEFEQQRNETLNPKDSMEAELMYELMHYKKMLIVEALNAPQYNLFDNYGNKFITNKYIVEFSDKSRYGRTDWFGSTFKCKNEKWSGRKDNFNLSMPIIIGVKKGPVYVNLPTPPNSFEPITEFEVDLRKAGHCFRKSSRGKIKQCSISKYNPNQALLRSNKEKIKVAFNRNLRDCKTAYNDPKFDNLKFLSEIR